MNYFCCNLSDIYGKYTFFMDSLAVKTELLREQNRRIDEHCYYVDVEFDTLVAMVIKTVLYIDMKLYVYRQQREGQSVPAEGWIKHYPEHEKVAFTLAEWYLSLISNRKKSVDKIAYFEEAIQCVIDMKKYDVRTIWMDGLFWGEVDSLDDYRKAEKNISSGLLRLL